MSTPHDAGPHAPGRADGRRAFALPTSARRAARDVDAEFAFHLEERIDELVERGVPRAEAEREVRARFGDVEGWRRETATIDRRAARRAHGRDTLGGVLRDVRLALRGMARRPGLTAAIVLTLALAIGAGTAIFGVVDAVLLRPLATPWQSELYAIREDLPALGLTGASLGPPAVEDLMARDDLFAAVAAYSGTSLTLTGEGAARRLRAARTMGDFFGTFGARPILGTTYRAERSEEGAHQVVVLSHGFWQELTGGDASIVGRTIELDGARHEVLGVMGPDFRFPRTAQLWVPQRMNAAMREPNAYGRLIMSPVARVRTGLSPEQLAAGLRDQERRWRTRFAQPDGEGVVLTATPLVAHLAGDLRPALLVLLGAVGFVLLIASANVASLQLVRAIARSRELAVRASLGAGRLVIARQLLVESLVLAAAGGAAGVGVAVLLLRLLRVWAVGEYERLADVRLDLPVLGVAALVTLGVGILFGLAPALRAARTDLNGVLKESGRVHGGVARNRPLQTAVLVQVALTLVLLLGAGVLTRSLGELVALDPGFRSAQVHTLELSIAGERYAEPAARIAFFERYLARLRGTPGIEAAAVVSGLPFGGGTDSSPFTLGDVPPVPDEPERHANLVVVSPGYFRAMGIPVQAGRDFEPADRDGAPLTAIIDAELARTWFGDASPIGRTISQGRDATIVGVVGTVKQRTLDEADKATVYYSNGHNHWIRSMQLVVRSTLPLATVQRMAESAARELDPAVPVSEPRTLDELVARSVATERLAMGVMLGFAALSLALALLGIHGVASYVVSQRVPEIGIRLALGATPGRVVRQVLLGGVGLVAAGAAAGLLAFLLLGARLDALLHGISPRDPATIALGLGAVLATAALACWIPARRAARVAPTEAIRGA